ncbi:hypothetical protein [Streptomyces sp. 7N604]|uniref:hypothetical protein n=1 Tax=Streptomyces sp. 7N604 TaxID=3457415 RepID=UPI003FD43FB0
MTDPADHGDCPDEGIPERLRVVDELLQELRYFSASVSAFRLFSSLMGTVQLAFRADRWSRADHCPMFQSTEVPLTGSQMCFRAPKSFTVMPGNSDKRTVNADPPRLAGVGT